MFVFFVLIFFVLVDLLLYKLYFGRIYKTGNPIPFRHLLDFAYHMHGTKQIGYVSVHYIVRHMCPPPSRVPGCLVIHPFS